MRADWAECCECDWHNEGVDPRFAARRHNRHHGHRVIFQATGVLEARAPGPRPEYTSLRVPSGPFRDRFNELIRGGETQSEICRRLNWLRADDGRCDTNRLVRTLGVTPYRPDKPINRSVASQLLSGLRMDPHEGGL